MSARLRRAARDTTIRDQHGVARRAGCERSESMPNVPIRDVPDDISAGLQRRTEAAGQSLQQYLSRELARVARSRTMSKIIARIEERSGGPLTLA